MRLRCVFECVCARAEMKDRRVDASLLHDSETDSTPSRVHLKREDPPPGNGPSPTLGLFLSQVWKARAHTHTHIGVTVYVYLPKGHQCHGRLHFNNTNKGRMVYFEVIQTVQSAPYRSNTG